MRLSKVCAVVCVLVLLIGLVGCSGQDGVLIGEAHMDWSCDSGLPANFDVGTYAPFDSSAEAGLIASSRLASVLASASGQGGLVSPRSVDLNTRFSVLSGFYRELGYTVYPIRVPGTVMSQVVSDDVVLRVECDCDLTDVTSIRSFGVYPSEFTYSVGRPLSGTLVRVIVDELLSCSSVDDVIALVGDSLFSLEAGGLSFEGSSVAVWITNLVEENAVDVLVHANDIGLSGVFFTDASCADDLGYVVSEGLNAEMAELGVSFPVCVTSAACEEAVWGTDDVFRGVRFEFEGSSNLTGGLLDVPDGVLLVPESHSDVVLFCNMATLSYDYGNSLLPVALVASGAACEAFSPSVVCLYSGDLKGVLGALFGDSGASMYLNDALLVDISGISPVGSFPGLTAYGVSAEAFGEFSDSVVVLPVGDCPVDLGTARGFVCCSSSLLGGYSRDRSQYVSYVESGYSRLIDFWSTVCS